MADVTLEVLGAQMAQLLRELAEVRKELADVKAAMLHIRRDSQIKHMLDRIDGQVRKLEEEAGDGA
jgi:hypothetical protein